MTAIPQNKQFQTPIPVQPASEDSRINFSALFSTLWRGKWIVAFKAHLLPAPAASTQSRLSVPQPHRHRR
jgi:LPS O-antigen subunit length determinant protein (WzzB/FepE family)